MQGEIPANFSSYTTDQEVRERQSEESQGQGELTLGLTDERLNMFKGQGAEVGAEDPGEFPPKQGQT